MGKKYLDTREGSLEQSILGVWQTAIEEKDARMDGRTKQYKEHRAKLEAARLRREKKNLNKEEVELTEKVDKKLANATLSMNKNQKFVKGSGDFVPKIYLSKDSLEVLKKRFGKLPREFPSPNTGMEVVSLINFALGSKDGRGPYDTEDGDSKSPKLYNNDSGKVVGKPKTVGDAVKMAGLRLESIELEEGSKEEYQKFFNAAMKKFGIDSPADLKSDEEKKKFFDYVDKNYKGEKDEEVQKLRKELFGLEEGKMSDIDQMMKDGKSAEEIAKTLKLDVKAVKKVMGESYEIGTDEYRKHTQDVTPGEDGEWVDAVNKKNDSMREALAKVWGVSEGKSPFEKKSLTKEVKDGKTMTGKKIASVDINPTIKEKTK